MSMQHVSSRIAESILEVVIVIRWQLWRSLWFVWVIVVAFSIVLRDDISIIIQTWFIRVARRYRAYTTLKTYVMLDLGAIAQYLWADVRDIIFTLISHLLLTSRTNDGLLANLLARIVQNRAQNSEQQPPLWSRSGCGCWGTISSGVALTS